MFIYILSQKYIKMIPVPYFEEEINSILNELNILKVYNEIKIKI